MKFATKSKLADASKIIQIHNGRASTNTKYAFHTYLCLLIFVYTKIGEEKFFAFKSRNCSNLFDFNELCPTNYYELVKVFNMSMWYEHLLNNVNSGKNVGNICFPYAWNCFSSSMVVLKKHWLRTNKVNTDCKRQLCRQWCELNITVNVTDLRTFYKCNDENTVLHLAFDESDELISYEFG